MFAINPEDISKCKQSNKVAYRSLGFGEVVSYNTLQEMKKVINASVRNNDIIQYARNIIQNCKEKDWECELNAIYNYVRDHSRYTRDPYKLEYIQTPPVALEAWNNGEIFFGDCDDLTVLVLSLMKAVGNNVKLIAASYKPDKELTHVYGAVNLRSRWVIVEPIKKNVPLGWEAPNNTRKVEVYV